MTRRYATLGRALLLSLVGGVGLALASCQSGKKQRTLVESIGAQSEVLLVAPRQVMQSDVMDTLQQILAGAAPGLNQVEPFFRVARLNAEAYTRQYTIMHSILMVRLDPKAKEPTIGVTHDDRARPQTILQITAPTLDALRHFLPLHTQLIRDQLLDGQLLARQQQLRRKHSKKVNDEMRRQFGHTICVPEELQFTKTGHDFLWASDKQQERSHNFVCYTLPYTGQPIHEDTCFAHLRDSVMERNIPGSTPRQWMQTVWEGHEPLITTRLRRLEGRVAVEARGLWEMREGAMGGPFVSLARIDTASRLITICEGFVFSPSTTKRDLVRTMEAALRTWR